MRTRYSVNRCCCGPTGPVCLGCATPSVNLVLTYTRVNSPPDYTGGDVTASVPFVYTTPVSGLRRWSANVGVVPGGVGWADIFRMECSTASFSGFYLLRATATASSCTTGSTTGQLLIWNSGDSTCSPLLHTVTVAPGCFLYAHGWRSFVVTY